MCRWVNNWRQTINYRCPSGKVLAGKENSNKDININHAIVRDVQLPLECSRGQKMEIWLLCHESNPASQMYCILEPYFFLHFFHFKPSQYHCLISQSHINNILPPRPNDCTDVGGQDILITGMAEWITPYR